MAIPASRWTAVLSLVLSLAVAAGCSGPEARQAKHMERGKTYLAQENYDKARVEFRNALQIDPNNAEAHFQAGVEGEKTQEMREAVGQFLAAIEADPNHIQARAHLGRMYVFGGVPDKAMETIEPALAKGEDSDLLTVRGAVRVRKGDMDGAVADTKRALELDPDNENALSLLASIYVQTNKSDEALALLKEGVKRKPESADLRMVLAQFHLQHGDRDAAEAELKQLIVMKPKDVSLRYRLAQFYLGGKEKNVDRAEQVLREAVAAVPDAPASKMTLVEFLANQRSKQAAEREFVSFVDKEPKNHELRLGLGQFYERIGQPAKAEAVYLKTIEQSATEAPGLTARNRLAAIKVQASKPEEARKLIAEVLDKNPRDNDALLLRGNLALMNNDPVSAIADLRAVLRDQPNSAGVLRTLARAHLQNNEPALAEENIRAAVAAHPKDLDARIDLARMLSQRGDADQSLKVLEAVVVDAPQNVTARELLCRAQLGARKWDAASRTAEDLKVLKPELGIGYYLAGLVAEAQQKYPQGAVEFQKALELQPNTAEPLTALVRVKLAQKQPDAALKLLDDEIARNPKNTLPRNLKGEVLLSQKQYPQAVASFEEAIAQSSQWWLPYRNLAYAQLAGKDTSAATQTYLRGLQATKNATPLALDLASLYERTGKSDDAIKVYEGLVEREPTSEVAANNLAMLLVSYRTDRASIDRAHALVDRFANSQVPAYLNTYGWVKYKRGEFEAALPTLQQAVDKVPASPLMRYHLGMAQYKAGQVEQARANLKLAVAGKDFKGIEEARSTLQQIGVQTNKNSG